MSPASARVRPRVLKATSLPSGPCPLCGRVAAVCWALPCLELQTALDKKDEKRLAAWMRDVGVTIVTKSGRRL